VVPNIGVTLTNPATGQVRRTTSNGAGIYLFANVGIGHLTLGASAPGFREYIKNDIVVNVGQTLEENIALTVGSTGQTVNVQAEALQVQTETNEVSTLISAVQVSQLATNGRNISALETLGLGVSSNEADFNGVVAPGASAGISFNGTRSSHNIYMLDGGEMNDRGCGGCYTVLPSLDAISEFQTLDSNYAPDYGIGSGGQILMAIKSGSHDFHGALWEFNRNEDYDANNYFTNLAGQARPEFRLNVPGGNIGGPLWIPHVYNDSRKRTFFFVNEEWRRLIRGSTPSVTNTIASSNFPVAGQALTYTVPSNGSAPIVPVTSDPAKLLIYTTDGLTAGQPFPDNTIPANLIDPNAVLELNAGTFPHPNLGVGQYISSIPQPTNIHEDIVRIDHSINSKLQIMGHFVHDSATITSYPTQWGDSSYPTTGSVFAQPGYVSVIKLTQMISSSLLNETSVNYDADSAKVTNIGVSLQPTGWTATSFFPITDNIGPRMPEIDLGAPYSTNWSSNYWPWHNAGYEYQIRDDLSWSKQRHELKVGFSYLRYVKNQQLQANTQGTAVFNSTTFSGDSYVNFLLGDDSSFTQLETLTGKHWVNNNYSFYGNDNWHATSRLTLNVGVRFDGMPHAFERYNQFANFVPTDYNQTNAAVFDAAGSMNSSGSGFATFNGTPFYLNGIEEAGVNGFPRGNVQNTYDTWQPRVGFAYNFKGEGKTVIRGGFGTFYERVQGNDVYNAALNPPFAFQPSATNVYFSNPDQSAITGAISSATAAVFPSNLYNLDYHYPNPGTAMFSLGVQRELAPSIISVLQYVGSTGWDQNDERMINTLPLNSSNRQGVAKGTYNANEGRIYTGFSSIEQEENETNFSYNGLQAGLRMENKHGLTMQLAYTWSHEIDVVSGDLTGTSDPFDLKYDHGSGQLDRRHIFNASYIYSLPFFAQSGDALARTIIGGWQFSGVTIAQRGTPVNVTYGPDTLGLGGGTTNRPNLVGKVAFPKKLGAWFDPTAFAAPLAPWDGGLNQGFGNARKDSLVGPGRLNFNLALFKEIALTSSEGPKVELRFESFNTFNHTQYDGIDSNFTDGNFGHVTSTYDPRVLQLGGKFLF
jgi:hypothetical protein